MQANQDHTRAGLLATGAVATAPTKRKPADGAEVVEVQVIVIDGAATKAKLKKAKANSKKKLKTTLTWATTPQVRTLTTNVLMKMTKLTPLFLLSHRQKLVASSWRP